MPRALKIILLIILFIGFFEAGLLSSYTIITSEAPDVKGLIDLQINTIAEFFSSENINNALIKDPKNINITNKIEVVNKVASLGKVDGIALDSLNVSTYESSSNEEFGVNITGLGFSSPNTTRGQIILSGNPDYIITATAMASNKNNGIVIDINTIKIVSILKFYNQNNSNSNTNLNTNSNSNNSQRITIG